MFCNFCPHTTPDEGMWDAVRLNERIQSLDEIVSKLN